MLKISHFTLYVLDLDKAYEVYTQKLGYAVRADITNFGYRWLTIGPQDQPDIEITLSQVGPGGMMSEESVNNLRAILEKSEMNGGVLEVDDCQAAYEHLLSKGIEFTAPPKEEFFGIQALFKDGCGNWYSMTQRK